MSTASIPELRRAQTRARARLSRAAARYGKRALARRGSGEGDGACSGAPSEQEAARLRELLAAAEAMTAAVREHRAAVNWQPREQPWAGVAGANPDPLSVLWWAAFRLDGARAAGDPAMTVEAGRALREAAIAVWERGLNRASGASRVADDGGNSAAGSG